LPRLLQRQLLLLMHFKRNLLPVFRIRF
jgi:hypothetical protein